MHILRKTIAAAALAALAFGGHSLYAQPGGADEDAEVTVPMETEAQISPAEMREQVASLISEMQGMLKRVVDLQQVARKEKDVIKLNCVNDKLLQVKQLLNIADEAENELVEAIAQQDEADRYHQYGQVTISHEKVSVLRDEAEACIGEELIFLGPTEVETDAPDIQDDPTDDDTFEDDLLLEDPAYASPFN